MKVISLWQPWSSLIILGHKAIETRGWAAPRSLIGQRIGIAATKFVKPEQLAAMDDPFFQRHYEATGLPGLNELPRGGIIGTALLEGCVAIDAELVSRLTAREVAFGWFKIGRYAWILRDPRPFTHVVVARGFQGIWEYDPHGTLALPYQTHPDQEGKADLRGDL